NNTLMKAQDLVEQMKHGAQKDADLILKEAEMQAEGIARAGREEMAAIKRQTLDLKKQKMLFVEKVQSAMRMFQRVIEMDTQEEDKINPAPEAHAPGETPAPEDTPREGVQAVRPNR
ncbi:MAG TPA: DivIVA domain-containing protein, partial [Nitrospiria bacterium]|nr:DivIVA domain-containing protein [Nitrospiria bacterium]